MSGDTLKVALIGCGKMGMHHATAIGLQEQAELVAVADPALAQDPQASPLPESVRVYAEVERMLTEARPDVVHVVTPPATHAELALQALEHGAHVYVEKPFALDSDSARRVLDKAREKGLKVCAGHQLLMQEPAERLRSYLGLIGDIVHVESYFAFRPVRKAPDGRGNISAVDQLFDILPHPVYTLLDVLGDRDGQLELCSTQASAEGEVRAIVRRGSATGMLVVTLRGRPVESYLRVVGTNGSIEADFVLGGVTKLCGPGASAVSLALKPYSSSRQMLGGSTRGIFKKVFGKQKSYAGLAEMTAAFYGAIREGREPPVSPRSIRETVELCEAVGARVRAAAETAEQRASEALERATAALEPCDPQRRPVLVTGGTGFLGREVVRELRGRGWPVRVLARKQPAAAQRVAGADYVVADLAHKLPPEVCAGVGTVVHLAAETAGGLEAHRRNTVTATQHLLDAAVAAGVERFVNISSIAVLKPSREVGGPLSEESPVDGGNLGRGPYVWAKAEAESMVAEYGRKHGLDYRTIRLGPLVDFRQFEPPGRLGRELGPLFVAMGSRRDRLSVCDVGTAAEVIRYFVDSFEQAPRVLNLVEPEAPTRAELAQRHRERRADLRFLWMPAPVLRLLSWQLIGLQKVLRRGKEPLNVYAAFASERYDTALAAKVVERARQQPARQVAERPRLAAQA